MSYKFDEDAIIEYVRSFLERRYDETGHLNKHVKYHLAGIKRGENCAIKVAPFIRKKNIAILDFGCGSGLFALGLHKILNGKIKGIDIDNELIETAKTWLRLNPIKKIDFKSLDVRIKKLEQGFDLIFANDLLEHVPDRLEYLRLLEKQLKIDGLIYIKTTNRLNICNIFQDEHVGIPFVCVLPKIMRNKIISNQVISHLIKRKESPIFDYSFKWELERLFKESGFKILKDFNPMPFLGSHEYLLKKT